MNRNQGQGHPAAPFTIAGNRFSRPWVSNRNPLQQVMPGASQMSTGGSYGTATRARGGLPMNHPAVGPSSQQAPAPVAGHTPFPFTAPWSQTQPSQHDYDYHQGLRNASGADTSQPAAFGGGGFLEPLAHSQPSHTAAMLLEELQGRSVPAPIPAPATDKEESLPLLNQILEKLAAFEKKQDNLQKSLEAVKAQMRTQATFLEPTADVMSQALVFMKDAASKQAKILTELAVQTSPSLVNLAPPPPLSTKPTSAPIDQLKDKEVAPAQRVRAAAAIQPTQLFSALVAEKTFVGVKRPRHHVNEAAAEEEEEEEEQEDDEDEVSSRLARRVQRHRRMMAQSKALAPER
ncbi:hypothetical protein Ndes2437B_g06036 [Nannochloris sp. 'desiccata']|nr:hypothetical protein KSW81_007989 [Chlorella desiccata (nom. nud.)]